VSFTWDGNALPNTMKDNIKVEFVPVGGGRRMLDGTLRVDLATTKARVVITWGGLTKAQRDALKALFDAGTVGDLVLPDGQTITNAIATHNGWQETQVYDVKNNPTYEVTMTFEES